MVPIPSPRPPLHGQGACEPLIQRFNVQRGVATRKRIPHPESSPTLEAK